MGLFDRLRRRDERAIPDPGSPEYEQMVSGSALPEGSASMGEPGWTSAEAQTRDVGQPAAPDPGAGQPSRPDPGAGQPSRPDPGRQDDSPPPGGRVQRGSGAPAGGLPTQGAPAPGAPGEGDGEPRSIKDEVFAALGDAGVRIPGAGGFGGGISPPRADRAAQLEQLAAKRDAGELTDAEFEALKRRLPGG